MLDVSRTVSFNCILKQLYNDDLTLFYSGGNLHLIMLVSDRAGLQIWSSECFLFVLTIWCFSIFHFDSVKGQEHRQFQESWGVKV